MSPSTYPEQVILALESSTDTLSLALQTPAGCWQREQQGSAQASSHILGQIELLVQEAGISWSDLHLLVCGRGPGAFTGVRVAVAVAQGLAVARGIALLPLSGLLAMAEAARIRLAKSDAFEILALQDARMGQAYAALCRWDGRTWQQEPEFLVDYADIAALPQAYLAGNVRPALLAAGCPLPAHLIDSQPTAAYLLQVAEYALAAGLRPVQDAALLQPIYVRNKVAQTTAERTQAAAGKQA